MDDKITFMLNDGEIRVRFNISGQRTIEWRDFFKLMADKGKSFEELMQMALKEYNNASDIIGANDGQWMRLAYENVKIEENRPLVESWEYAD